MTTLLQKAKARKLLYLQNRVSENESEMEELAVAWFKGDVSFTQASAATGVKGSTLYGNLAITLRRAIMSKRLTLRK